VDPSERALSGESGQLVISPSFRKGLGSATETSMDVFYHKVGYCVFATGPSIFPTFVLFLYDTVLP